MSILFCDNTASVFVYFDTSFHNVGKIIPVYHTLIQSIRSYMSFYMTACNTSLHGKDSPEHFLMDLQLHKDLAEFNRL